MVVALMVATPAVAVEDAAHAVPAVAVAVDIVAVAAVFKI